MPKVNTDNILGKSPGARTVDQDFELGKVLGKGAFGTVRLAISRSSGDKFACKSIAKAKLVCREDVQDVQREVAIMNHVAGHPNVVNSKATYEDKNFVHIVMELCTGGELFDSIVESGSYSERKAAGVFRKMVDMLHHCHELGVMHRDLKPENFLLTSRNADKAEIKATDFGLSIFFKPGERFNELVGSPYYVAPEVLKKNYSYQADLWSLGVILYILLSGLPPFWGDNEEQIFKMVLKGNVDFATDPWPKISPAAKDLVKRLLTMDATKRATCSDILQHPWLKQEKVASEKPLDNVVLTRMKNFAAMNKLKKTALMVVGSCLSAEEIAGMKRLFKTIDADGSGTITVKELQDAIKQWGHKIPVDEITKIMAAADVDGDGFIDYNEFVAATINQNQLEKEDLIYRAFKEFDTDGSNTITVDELEKALEKFGIQDDTKDLLAAADKNGDGQIDYQEFVLLMRETNKELKAANAGGNNIFRKLMQQCT
eukprot:TRINITY_DN2687_c0_g1_i3.p1 TRINITY_DN2687_c0_g1~~TRINITY_DN2687_c0_g1_i3.p1  ORF type:complete len:486 (-),score=84.59 TRINITY_DN2687_c0_g1_i3:272-1729(-)